MHVRSFENVGVCMLCMVSGFVATRVHINEPTWPPPKSCTTKCSPKGNTSKIPICWFQFNNGTSEKPLIQNFFLLWCRKMYIYIHLLIFKTTRCFYLIFLIDVYFVASLVGVNILEFSSYIYNYHVEIASQVMKPKSDLWWSFNYLLQLVTSFINLMLWCKLLIKLYIDEILVNLDTEEALWSNYFAF